MWLRGRKRLPVVMLLLAGMALAVLRFNDIPVGSFFDDAHYLVLAESMVDGQGYRLINYPHAPVEDAFPPGWPLLLAGVTAVFGPSLFWPRVLAFACWLTAIVLAASLLTPRVPEKLAPWLLALLVFNPHLIGMAGTAMSEAAFLAFTLLALVLLQIWVDQPARRSPGLLLALGGAAFLAMLVRTIGVALVITAVIFVLRTVRRQHWRWLALAAVVGGLGLGLLAWFNQRSGGVLIFSPTYSGHLAYLLPRWAEFLRFWEVDTAVSWETLANAVVPVFGLRAITALLTPGVMQVLAGLVVALVAVGFVLRCRQITAVEVYVLGYLAIFYVWIVYIQDVQPRIALPLIPFGAYYLVTALAHLVQWVLRPLTREKTERWVQAALALLLVAYLSRNLYQLLNPARNDIVDLTAGTLWLDAHIPPEAVVMSPNPVPDYLYLRRLTVDYPTDADTLLAQITAQSVDYILVRPNLTFWRRQTLDARGDQILHVIQSNPSQFELIYRDMHVPVWIYQVENDS